MKFIKADLIARIDECVNLARSRAIAFNEGEELKVAAHREKYLAAHSESWARVADLINRNLAAGKIPITKSEIPEDLLTHYDEYLALYKPYRATVRQPQVDQLLQLRSLLNATTDDVVSSNALKEMGFSNLRNLGLL